MDGLDQVHREFEADLDRLEHLLQMVNLLRDFGAAPLADVDGEDRSVWESATRLWENAKERRTDVPIFSGSLLLYLCGRYEYFFRSVIEAAAEEIAEKCGEFSELPENLQKALVRNTAEAVQNSSRYGYDSIQVRAFISTLSTNFGAEGGIGAINSRCLSLTESNMRPRVMQDLLTKVNISNFWNEMGKQFRVKEFLNATEDGESTKAAKALLDEIMDERNAVAHPTASTQFPDPDQVLRYSKYLRVIGSEGLSMIRLQINGFQP